MIVIFILFLLSVALNIAGVIAIRNFLKREERYEVIITQQHDYVLSIRDDIKRSYANMKALDDKDMFEKDDEVGGAFAQIVAISRELDAYVNAAEAEEGEDNS